MDGLYFYLSLWFNGENRGFLILYSGFDSQERYYVSVGEMVKPSSCHGGDCGFDPRPRRYAI